MVGQVLARESGGNPSSLRSTSDKGSVSVEAAQPNLTLSQLAGLPDKTIILGVLDLADENVESSATVAARIEAALAYVSPERLAVAPDCGMKYLPRDVANAKLQAMVEGAALVRAKLEG